MNLTLRNPIFVGALRQVVTVVVVNGTLPATDAFESYPLGADLNAQTGGTNFGVAPYAARWNFASGLVTDAMEAYTPGAALNGLSGGTNMSASWTSAYVDRTNYTGAFAYDSFETYVVTTNLNGSNAGQTYTSSGSWAGAYASR